MISSPEHPLVYDRTWQKRLLVLTLIVAIGIDGLFIQVFSSPEARGWDTTGLILLQTTVDLLLLVQLLRGWKNVFPGIAWRAVSLWIVWLIVGSIAERGIDNGFFVAVIISGVSLPLLLLATGKPGKWGMFLAMLILVVYVVFLGLLVWAIMTLDTID